MIELKLQRNSHLQNLIRAEWLRWESIEISTTRTLRQRNDWDETLSKFPPTEPYKSGIIELKIQRNSHDQNLMTAKWLRWESIEISTTRTLWQRNDWDETLSKFPLTEPYDSGIIKMRIHRNPPPTEPYECGTIEMKFYRNLHDQNLTITPAAE